MSFTTGTTPQFSFCASDVIGMIGGDGLIAPGDQVEVGFDLVKPVGERRPLRHPRRRQNRWHRLGDGVGGVDQEGSRSGVGSLLQSDFESKCRSQRCFKFEKLRSGQFADEVGEARLLNTHQTIALDGAVVLQAFARANRNLCGQAVPLREHRGTHDGRVVGVNQGLTANHHEGSGGLRIAGRAAHTIEFAALHASSKPAWNDKASFISAFSFAA